jgi:hypothetical protein
VTQERLYQSEVGFKDHSNQINQIGSNWPRVRRIRTIFSRFQDNNSFGALEQFRNFTRRQNIVKKGDDPLFGHLARISNEFRVNAIKNTSFPDFTANRAVFST